MASVNSYHQAPITIMQYQVTMTTMLTCSRAADNSCRTEIETFREKIETFREKFEPAEVDLYSLGKDAKGNEVRLY